MKVFRDMTMSGPRDLLVSTIAEIENTLCGGWKRDKQIEEQARSRAMLGLSELCFCFTCTPTSSRKAARLALNELSNGKLWLSNIVPEELGRLTHDEFNAILEEFLQEFARPAAAKTGVIIEVTSGEVTVDDWFSKETAEKLRQFLYLSHGSTLRTDDHERWMDFLLAVHREGAKVHGDVLGRWLEEDAQCDEYAARELARDYQQSQELLHRYEQLQGA